MTVKLAGVLPNATAVAPVKPIPMIVTLVPPVCGPEDGEMALTVGAPCAKAIAGASSHRATRQNRKPEAVNQERLSADGADRLPDESASRSEPELGAASKSPPACDTSKFPAAVRRTGSPSCGGSGLGYREVLSPSKLFQRRARGRRCRNPQCVARERLRARANSIQTCAHRRWNFCPRSDSP